MIKYIFYTKEQSGFQLRDRDTFINLFIKTEVTGQLNGYITFFIFETCIFKLNILSHVTRKIKRAAQGQKTGDKKP